MSANMSARLVVTADARQVVTASQQAQTSMQALVNRTTQVDRASRGAAESARAFGAATDSAGDQVERLRLQIDPLYAAQQRLSSQTDLVALAFRRGEIPLELHDQMLEQLQGEYRRTAVAQGVMVQGTGQTSAAMRLLGVNAQQAQQGMRMLPFQLNQMAQMGAVTGQWMQAVSIQLPDILQGFGAARLVFLGTAVGLASAFLPALIRTVRGSREAADAVKTFDQSLTELQDGIGQVDSATEILRRSSADLTAEYGRMAQAVRDLAQEELELGLARIERALQDALMNVQDVTSRIARGIRRDVEGEGLGNTSTNEIMDISRALAEVERQFGVTGAAAEPLVWAMQQLDRADTFDEQRLALERIGDILAANNIPLSAIPESLFQAMQRANEFASAMVEAEAKTDEAAAAVDPLEQALRNAAAAAQLLGGTDMSSGIVAALGVARELSDLLQISYATAFQIASMGPTGVSGPDAAISQIRDRGTGLGAPLTGVVSTWRTPEPPASRGGGGGSGGGGGLSEHARTVQDIERRMRQLTRSYADDTEAANAWREEALANLDAASAGYEDFAAQVEMIYGEMLADAYQADLERREDWRAGIQRGLDQILEDQLTWADTWENVVTGAIERGEDAWVDWVTTGRLSLSELVDFAIAEFARLAYQQAIQPALSGIFGSLSGMFGGGGGGGLFGGRGLFGGAAIKSHSGSIVGAGSTMASLGAMGPRDELAVVERGQGIFTPRQMENADALLRALASRPARAEGGVIVAPRIEVNNYSSARVETRERADGSTEINIMDQVEREMAGRMQQPGSALNRALRAQGVRPVFGNGRS